MKCLVSIPGIEQVKPEEIEKALKENPDAKAVFTTLSETSSGGVTDIEKYCQNHTHFSSTLVVDAVSGLGVTPLYTDKWGVDAVVSGSQKASVLPPL